MSGQFGVTRLDPEPVRDIDYGDPYPDLKYTDASSGAVYDALSIPAILPLTDGSFTTLGDRSRFQKTTVTPISYRLVNNNKYKVIYGKPIPYSYYLPVEDTTSACRYCAVLMVNNGGLPYAPWNNTLSGDERSHSCWVAIVTRDAMCRDCARVIHPILPADTIVACIPISTAYRGSIENFSKYGINYRNNRRPLDYGQHAEQRAQYRMPVGGFDLADSHVISVDEVYTTDYDYDEGGAIKKQLSTNSVLAVPVRETGCSINIIQPMVSLIVKGLKVITVLPGNFSPIKIRHPVYPLSLKIMYNKGDMVQQVLGHLADSSTGTIGLAQLVYSDVYFEEVVGTPPMLKTDVPGEASLFWKDDVAMSAVVRDIASRWFIPDYKTMAGLKYAYKVYKCYNCFRVRRSDTGLPCEAKFCTFRGINLGLNGVEGNSTVYDKIVSLSDLCVAVPQDDIAKPTNSGKDIIAVTSNSRCCLGSLGHRCRRLPSVAFLFKDKTKGVACSSCFELFGSSLTRTGEVQQSQLYYSMSHETYQGLVRSMDLYSNRPAVVLMTPDPFLKFQNKHEKRLICALAARDTCTSIYTRRCIEKFKADGPDLERTIDGVNAYRPKYHDDLSMSDEYFETTADDQDTQLCLAMGIAVMTSESSSRKYDGTSRYEIVPNGFAGNRVHAIVGKEFYNDLMAMKGVVANWEDYIQSAVYIHKMVDGYNFMKFSNKDRKAIPIYYSPVPTVVGANTIVIAATTPRPVDEDHPAILRREDALRMNLPGKELGYISQYMIQMLTRAHVRNKGQRLNHGAMIKSVAADTFSLYILDGGAVNTIEVQYPLHLSSMYNSKNHLYCILNFDASVLPSNYFKTVDGIAEVECFITSQRRVPLWFSSLLQATGTNSHLLDTSM